MFPSQRMFKLSYIVSGVEQFPIKSNLHACQTRRRNLRNLCLHPEPIDNYEIYISSTTNPVWRPHPRMPSYQKAPSCEDPTGIASASCSASRLQGIGMRSSQTKATLMDWGGGVRLGGWRELTVRIYGENWNIGISFRIRRLHSNQLGTPKHPVSLFLPVILWCRLYNLRKTK